MQHKAKRNEVTTEMERRAEKLLRVPALNLRLRCLRRLALESADSTRTLCLSLSLRFLVQAHIVFRLVRLLTQLMLLFRV